MSFHCEIIQGILHCGSCRNTWQAEMLRDTNGCYVMEDIWKHQIMPEDKKKQRIDKIHTDDKRLHIPKAQRHQKTLSKETNRLQEKL